MKNTVSVSLAFFLMGLIHPFKMQAQIISVKAGTDFDIKANTILTADSIDFIPSLTFKLNGNDLFRNDDVTASSTIPHINRVYNFTGTTMNYSGSIKMRYTNDELNNLNESSLQMLINNGTSWSLESNSSVDTVENFIEKTVNGISLKEISAGVSVGCTPNTGDTTVLACGSFVWYGVVYDTSATSTRTFTNVGGCDSVVTLHLTVSTSNLYPPFGVVQNVVSNICSSRVYRYTASINVTGTTYNWILPTSVGGVSGVTVDSGDITRSRTILVRYTSNEAALLTDSMKVSTFNGCYSRYTSVKLTNIKLSTPAAPSTIIATNISANTCSNRRYRFTAPALPGFSNGSTATILAATGYLWSFVGNLSEFVTIDSGDVNSQKIVVVFSSNAAAGIGDSVKLSYSSSCGFSKPKTIKLTNTKLSPPSAPNAITVTALSTNICGARKYRYTAPVLPSATTSLGAATGYEWSILGNNLGANAVIDSGTTNSRIIVLLFTNNTAANNTDSIKVRYTSLCGNGAWRSVKLAIGALQTPAAPSTITMQIKSNECNARTYRYIAPAVLPIATSINGAATGYLWSTPTGTVGSTGTIDSGDVNSRIITVTYSSNAAAGAGDSIRLRYTSGCGDGKIKASKLTNILLSAPLAPASISIQTKSDVCNARTYRYIAPAVLPIASSVNGAATGYLWSTPTGTVGSTGTIDSGDVNSRIITVTYSSNEAAGAGDSIHLRYTSGCGDSRIKAQRLSNLVKNGCTPITKNVSTSRVSNSLLTSMELNVYPNPTTSQFNVQVKSSSTEDVVVRILDVQGRSVKQMIVQSNQRFQLGSELKSGIYFIQAKSSHGTKTLRVVKYQ